jgi:hypothetical protein
VKYKSNSVQNAIIGGVSYEYYKIKNFELTDGRYFTQNETEAGYRVAIVGAEIAKGLFPYESPLGKEIKISGQKAVIIGVIKKEGESILGPSFDFQVVIPFNFARVLMDPRSERADPIIYCKAKAGVTNKQLTDELTGIMRGVRKLKPGAKDNFALNETSLLTKGFDSFFEVLGTAGWIIGGFSILVGGFGIANIMFVSVRERTSLIGIQKSLGAKNLFILFQFLSESVILSLVGGATNVAIGVQNQGFRTSLVTLIGNNSFKPMIVETLEAKSVSFIHSKITDDHLNISCILLSENGEKTVINYQSPNQHLFSEDHDYSFLDRTSSVYMANMPDVSFTEKLRLAKYIKQQGKLLFANFGVVDCRRPKEQITQLIEQIDVLIVNGHEFADIVKTAYERISFNRDILGFYLSIQPILMGKQI